MEKVRRISQIEQIVFDYNHNTGGFILPIKSWKTRGRICGTAQRPSPTILVWVRAVFCTLLVSILWRPLSRLRDTVSLPRRRFATLKGAPLRSKDFNPCIYFPHTKNTPALHVPTYFHSHLYSISCPHPVGMALLPADDDVNHHHDGDDIRDGRGQVGADIVL